MDIGKLLALSLFLSGCGARQLEDGSDDPDEPLATPGWSSCFGKGEVESCAEACAADGHVCAANGCAVDPNYCGPGDCDTATQAFASGTEPFCTDETVGVFIPATCEEPIHWLFSNTLRCCCAEDE